MREQSKPTSKPLARSKKSTETSVKVRERIQRQEKEADTHVAKSDSQLNPLQRKPELPRPSLPVADYATLRPIATLGTPTVQPKMQVNEPNDLFEVEADRVADQVMRMPSGDLSAWNRPAPTLQLMPSVMRSEGAATPAVTPEVERNIAGMHGGGRPLDDSTQSFFEQRMGADFSNVRVHTDATAVQTSRDINARAFTIGNDIAFNAGEYNPNTAVGKHLLAHELTHTIQQGASSEIAQRAEVNGPYTGNRPDPSTVTQGYQIESDSGRIIQTGDGITYTIRQTEASVRSADSELQSVWSVENDPAAVELYGISASITRRPSSSFSLRLRAAVPGVHIIKATILLDGRVIGRAEYEQQVIREDWDFVAIGENVSANPLATMQDFIALVERVEAAYGGIPWQDVTTRLRKEYYPGPGGAYSGLRDAFQWGDLIDEQDEMPALETPPVDIRDIAALRQSQVVTVGSDEVDIGHVLTGVDSMNFPTVAGIFAAHDMEGPAAATWSGDVGSALVKYLRKESDTLEHIQDDEQRREEYYQNWASQKDMFGDYDGIAIANHNSLPESATLSERLRAYYIDSANSGVDRRFHNFCDASQLSYEGSTLTAESRERIQAQIANFADAFDIVDQIRDDVAYSLMDQGYYESPFAPLFGPPPSQHFREEHETQLAEALEWFTNRFIREVEEGLASEPN